MTAATNAARAAVSVTAQLLQEPFLLLKLLCCHLHLPASQ